MTAAGALLTTAEAILARILTHGDEATSALPAGGAVHPEVIRVAMRDGILLATDLYLPPTVPAPVVVLRTPYGRKDPGVVRIIQALVRRGYAVVAQDCRGTGDSEPDDWDYYVRESEDSYDLVEWISHQSWADDFIGGFGASYSGQTQWCMATHPAMSAIVPQVSGLGVAANTTQLHLFVNAYARTIGNGVDKLAIPITEMERHFAAETLADGYFDEPVDPPFPEAVLEHFPGLAAMSRSRAESWLWEHYCALDCAGRADFIKATLGARQVTIVEAESLHILFGQRIAHDALTLPSTDRRAMARSIQAPALMLTGWYDWGLNDALATWSLIREGGVEGVADRSRLIITPAAHHAPGYHEGSDARPELRSNYRNNATMLARWYETVRSGRTDHWPAVTYYLMGANEWRFASAWPVPDLSFAPLYLHDQGRLSFEPPSGASASDSYVYDPDDPTPTMGGSILSFQYPVGSVDVSAAQVRDDVLCYTSAPLATELDVVGPLKAVIWASTDAADTDFSVRLSDVFPDGRAIQLQSGILRARHRDVEGPRLLEGGEIYRFEIDMWATASRFRAGHRIRVDIASADFPRFNRNANRGGAGGPPRAARQTIFRDAEHPSHLILPVLPAA